MKLLVPIYTFFLHAPFALAQAAAGNSGVADADAPPPGFGEMFTQMIPLFLAVFFIFYFMVLKPQEKKIKAQQALLTTLKKGENVTTSSGLIGRVAGIEKDHILLEVSPNVKMKFEPTHITKRFEPESSEKSNS